jgi:hypothetical protein
VPVHDAEVHHLVQIGAAKPYGCSNAARRDHYFTFTFEMVESRMSDLCRYDGRQGDPRCGECRRPSDTDYLRSYGL